MWVTSLFGKSQWPLFAIVLVTEHIHVVLDPGFTIRNENRHNGNICSSGIAHLKHRQKHDGGWRGGMFDRGRSRRYVTLV